MTYESLPVTIVSSQHLGLYKCDAETQTLARSPLQNKLRHPVRYHGAK